MNLEQQKQVDLGNLWASAQCQDDTDEASFKCLLQNARQNMSTVYSISKHDTTNNLLTAGEASLENQRTNTT